MTPLGSSKDVEHVERGLLLGEGRKALFWKTLCACVIFSFKDLLLCMCFDCMYVYAPHECPMPRETRKEC